MNWTGDMKCEDAEQVLLLLKSSDCISHDLVEPFDHCEDKNNESESIDYYLVLRKWKDIHPASEFRCFVSHNRLIGKSLRKSLCDQSQVAAYIMIMSRSNTALS